MIGTPVKSPMSGTVTSVAVAVVTSVPSSGSGGVGLVGVDPETGDGVGHGLGRDGPVGGQLGQCGQRDMAAVDLEVLAQHPAVVRPSEAVGAQHPVAAADG